MKEGDVIYMKEPNKKEKPKYYELSVYLVLRFLVIAIMLRQLLKGNFENVFVCFDLSISSKLFFNRLIFILVYNKYFQYFKQALHYQ